MFNYKLHLVQKILILTSIFFGLNGDEHIEHISEENHIDYDTDNLNPVEINFESAIIHSNSSNNFKNNGTNSASEYSVSSFEEFNSPTADDSSASESKESFEIQRGVELLDLDFDKTSDGNSSITHTQKSSSHELYSKNLSKNQQNSQKNQNVGIKRDGPSETESKRNRKYDRQTSRYKSKNKDVEKIENDQNFEKLRNLTGENDNPKRIEISRNLEWMQISPNIEMASGVTEEYIIESIPDLPRAEAYTGHNLKEVEKRDNMIDRGYTKEKTVRKHKKRKNSHKNPYHQNDVQQNALYVANSFSDNKFSQFFDNGNNGNGGQNFDHNSVMKQTDKFQLSDAMIPIPAKSTTEFEYGNQNNLQNLLQHAVGYPNNVDHEINVQQHQINIEQPQIVYPNNVQNVQQYHQVQIPQVTTDKYNVQKYHQLQIPQVTTNKYPPQTVSISSEPSIIQTAGPENYQELNFIENNHKLLPPSISPVLDNEYTTPSNGLRQHYSSTEQIAPQNFNNNPEKFIHNPYLPNLGYFPKGYVRNVEFDMGGKEGIKMLPAIIIPLSPEMMQRNNLNSQFLVIHENMQKFLQNGVNNKLQNQNLPYYNFNNVFDSNFRTGNSHLNFPYKLQTFSSNSGKFNVKNNEEFNKNILQFSNVFPHEVRNHLAEQNVYKFSTLPFGFDKGKITGKEFNLHATPNPFNSQLFSSDKHHHHKYTTLPKTEMGLSKYHQAVGPQTSGFSASNFEMRSRKMHDLFNEPDDVRHEKNDHFNEHSNHRLSAKWYFTERSEVPEQPPLIMTNI